MRIGVYVDGYNLYYGARHLCGRGTSGWRWLDLRAFARSVVRPVGLWAGAQVHRVVYCTARIGGTSDPGSIRDQATYLDALQAHGSIDELALGKYDERVRTGPLATMDPSGRPVLFSPRWPLVIQDSVGAPVRDGRVIASVSRREEKGSDVNVASHLLIDALRGDIDCAVVISNDSDLKFPISFVRTLVPVGLVNPSRKPTAGDLRGAPTDGVGGHWWRKLVANDLFANQLPDPVGPLPKPVGW